MAVSSSAQTGKSSSINGTIPGAPPRTSFAKIREPLEVPNLLALQTESFDWLLGNEVWKDSVKARKASSLSVRFSPRAGDSESDSEDRHSRIWSNLHS